MIKSLRTAMADKYRSLPVAKNETDKANHLRFFFKKLKF